MRACPRCGEENPDRAKFCLSCGSPLGSDERAPESRRTVTILFADVVDSTGRGESTDPETTRHLLGRYFEAMSVALERHGGTVEKFIGDAVMAVFGIPTIHEDDALRAVRAARDMLDALDRLNAELAGEGWRPLAVRVGINTGEVVTGDPQSGQTLVTGDAVNVAARLEQAAGAGEILLGATTQQLTRDAVESEALPPLEVKGKTQPLEAHRVLALLTPGPGSGRRHDTPLVGRERELLLLEQAFERAVSEQGCHLFTLLGPAGVGKSRLVHEFVERVRPRADILRARCLPYGEGITYWPIVELAHAAAGITAADRPAAARERLGALLGDVESRDAIADRVASAAGWTEASFPNEELFWGVRRFLEALAHRRPLVVVIDDLHWAEATMLDLVEHVADLSREAPILLLAVARPELLDGRPTWGGGKMNATTILLEPLSGDQSVSLVSNLLGDEGLARTLHERVGERAEGNPLFVEELVAMLIDQGILRREGGVWIADERLETIAVPPTVAALVAARLDRLEAAERDLVGRASVVGKIFQRSAVVELSPPERRDELGTRLMTLVRKELVRPAGSAELGEEAFRFRHILVRDAAYGSLPKEQRADLHARFAAWLERTSADRLAEYQEVIAYHLEQAHDARAELGINDAVTAELGQRAAAYLADSGRRARVRRDHAAAVSLLERAARLIGDTRKRLRYRITQADSLAEVGRLDDMRRVLDEVQQEGERAGETLLALEARTLAAEVELFVNPAASEEAWERLIDELSERAEAAGDVDARVAAHLARGSYYLTVCQWANQVREVEAALELIEPEDVGQWNRLRVERLNAMRYGPTPASQGIEAAERDFDEAAFSRRFVAAPLYAMVGRADEARVLYREAIARAGELGLRLRVGALALVSGTSELIAGNLELAERHYGEGVAVLSEIGEMGVLSTLAAARGIVLARLGRLEEADEAIALARDTGTPNDISTQAGLRVAAAFVAVQRGQLADAERLRDEAVALVEPTDFRELRGWAFEAAAAVERAAGREAAWRSWLERALAEYDAKEDLADAARVRAELGDTGAGSD